MMEESFQLYTWQNPGWDITKGKHDPSKSRLRWGDTFDRLKPLYKKLEEKLGCLDFVWCLPKYEYWVQEIRTLWVLHVPSPEIFHLLDSRIWAQMYEDTETVEQLQEPSWDKLFVERSEGIQKLSAGNNKDITPLLCVPLSTSIQVLDKRFSVGPLYLNPRYQERYEALPTSENEAKAEHDFRFPIPARVGTGF